MDNRCNGVQSPTFARKNYILVHFFDLYDRSIIAWSISNRNDNALVLDTFNQAIKLNPDAHPLFHSDRGFQYTSRIPAQAEGTRNDAVHVKSSVLSG